MIEVMENSDTSEWVSHHPDYQLMPPHPGAEMIREGQPQGKKNEYTDFYLQVRRNTFRSLDTFWEVFIINVVLK